jgi:small subunit ribosomal protein S16
MVKIRLARGGAKKKPFYSIVATDSRKRRDSGYIERIGYFNPVAQGQEVRLQFEEDRLEYWVSQGAQISDRVKQLAREYKDPSIREKYLAAKEAKIAVAEKAKSEAEATAKAEAEATAKAEAKAEAEVKKEQAEEAPAEEAPAEEAPVEEAPVEAPAEEAPAEEAEAEEKDSK